jgi:hypothetical protein
MVAIILETELSIKIKAVLIKIEPMEENCNEPGKSTR